MLEMPISPNDLYRHRLLQEVAACSPNRILEVGIGECRFLRDAASLGADLIGVDTNPAAVERARAKGYDASVASADQLPFPDRTADVTVFSYTAHHIADWRASLAEAMRVTRGAIIILDPWHDERIPSQEVAARFERWRRAIDRSNGEVHNDNLSASTLLGELVRDTGAWSARCEYVLELVDLGVSQMKEIGERHLATAKDPNIWRPLLSQLIHQATHRGYSDDGAILLRIAKRRPLSLLFHS